MERAIAAYNSGYSRPGSTNAVDRTKNLEFVKQQRIDRRGVIASARPFSEFRASPGE